MKHFIHVSAGTNVPSIDRLVESNRATRLMVVEHPPHVGDPARAPLANGLVEGRRIHKHETHVRYSANIPSADGLVE